MNDLLSSCGYSIVVLFPDPLCQGERICSIGYPRFGHSARILCANQIAVLSHMTYISHMLQQVDFQC